MTLKTAVFREISANRWVLLLGPRQHGKSTGLVRVKQTLVDAGLVVSTVDLQAMPPCANYQEVLRWFSTEITKRFGKQCPYPPEDGNGILWSWFKTVFCDIVEPIVVIIDEAASIDNANYRNSFLWADKENLEAYVLTAQPS